MTIPSFSTVLATLIIFSVLLAISKRAWTSAATTLYVLCFALLSSFIKQAYLGVAMTLADMHFFLLRPLENFHLFFNYPLLGAILLGVCLGFTLCLVVGMRLEQPLRLFGMPRWAVLYRIAPASLLLLVVIGAVSMTRKDSQAPMNDGDAYAAFLSMYEQQHPGGVVGRLNVFFNNRSFEATLPRPREQTRFSKDQAVVAVSSEYPDLLLVLEESTFDPSMIRKCPKAECDNAMLHPMPFATRTQQAPLLVHTTGGGTWLAEFAVLSGFDWRVFGRGGAFAPVSLAPRLHVSLPLQLRALGYRTVAIYPTDGNFLSATSAYGYYGFDEFYDASQLGLPSEWGDTRDAIVFDRAFAKLQSADSRPVFVFLLTIRNHGPHGNKPQTIPPAFLKSATHTSIYMADYLARMRDSSNDYVRAAKQWLDSPRPRVIGWFGDHQPEAAWDFTEHPELLDDKRIPVNAAGKLLQYVTQYQFSANFGDQEQRVSREAMDISYLGAELMAFAGLPLDSGSDAARVVAKECGGLMINCSDRALINDYLDFRIHQLNSIQ